MVTPYPAWFSTWGNALRQLADRPATLFLIILAINALARPYSNCAHDARLYSLQVLNQAENGAYADDIFLRYGSQDQFSIFSRIVGPLAAHFGVKPTFFVLYLVFNTLFLWGLFRLIRRLFDDPLIATASLVFLVTGEMLYGGHGIFAVHEQFFTPRLVAVTLVLHALERLVAHRFVSAFLLVAIALTFHPLMAFGGLLIWLGYVAWVLVGARGFTIGFAAACAASILVVAIPAAGVRLFGQIDDDWHAMIRLSALYNYPDAWSYTDWLNHAVALGLGVAAVAWLFQGDLVRRPFFLVLTLSAVMGLLMTTIASLSPYALLFQGQPYRAVWILKIMQIPLGFMVLSRLMGAPDFLSRLVTLALATFFLVTTYSVNEWLLCLFAAPIALFGWRLLDQPSRSDWWWWAGVTTLFLGTTGWMLYRWGFIVAQRDVLLHIFDRVDFVRLLTISVPPAIWLIGTLVVVTSFANAGEQRALRWVCAAAWLGTPTFYFGLDMSVAGRTQYTRHGADITFVKTTLADRHGERLPTVYSSLGRPEYVWIDLRATSFYDGLQAAGVMFNRKTAVELQRRIDLVCKFEMDRIRKDSLLMTDDGKAFAERLYKTPFDGPPPTADDLVRLCAEPGLDYVVIPQEFPGLYSATNGRIYVYECSKVRNNAGLAMNARSARDSR